MQYAQNSLLSVVCVHNVSFTAGFLPHIETTANWTVVKMNTAGKGRNTHKYKDKYKCMKEEKYTCEMFKNTL